MKTPSDPQERPQARVLLVLSAELPAATSSSTLAEQVAEALAIAFEVDVLAMKGTRRGHIERIGGARVLRVPVAATDRAGFQRALYRQLQATDYQAVVAFDSLSWSVLPALPEDGPPVIVALSNQDPLVHQLQQQPVTDGPAASTLYPRAWAAPSRLVPPSRTLARTFSSILDPRTITVIRRGVDVSRFKPPSIDMGVDELHVAIFGGRSDDESARQVITMLPALQRSVDRVVVLGAAGSGDERLQQAGLVLVGVEDRHQLPQQLSTANVVIVISDGSDGALPYRMLESLACRRPTVVWGAPGLDRDVAAAGQLTLTSHGGDLASLMLRLRDPVVHERVARAGHRYVNDRANFAVLAHDWRTMLWETIGREPPAALEVEPVAQRRVLVPPTDAEATGSGPPGQMPPPVASAPVRTDPWVGETWVQASTAAAVNRIMLRTESGSAARPVPRSLQFVDVVDGPSPWTSDTIADGAPVPRSDSERQVMAISEPPKTIEQSQQGRDTQSEAKDPGRPKRRR